MIISTLKRVASLLMIHIHLPCTQLPLQGNTLYTRPIAYWGFLRRRYTVKNMRRRWRRVPWGTGGWGSHAGRWRSEDTAAWRRWWGRQTNSQFAEGDLWGSSCVLYPAGLQREVHTWSHIWSHAGVKTVSQQSWECPDKDTQLVTR